MNLYGIRTIIAKNIRSCLTKITMSIFMRYENAQYIWMYVELSSCVESYCPVNQNLQERMKTPSF